MTFLSVGPSLDFSSGAGAGVCAGDVVGVGTDAVVGVAGVADVAVAADAGVATATAVPVATFKLRASHAVNAGLGVGPMSIVVNRRKEIGKWSPVQMGMRLAMARATPFRPKARGDKQRKACLEPATKPARFRIRLVTPAQSRRVTVRRNREAVKP